MQRLFIFSISCLCWTTCGLPDGLGEYQEQVEAAIVSAEANRSELITALKKSKGEERTGIAFLIAHMQKEDLQNLPAALLLDNAKYAYLARNEFSWAREVPDSIFLNDVLPYVNLTESRDNWREKFYHIFKPIVSNCKSIEEAIDSINYTIERELKVKFNTKRPQTDMSPLESIQCNMATCTGLSILLVDAFRSIGIPARLVGTPNWASKEGNHNWVEVFVRGEWKFTEYYPSKQGLNHSWFLVRAGKANNSNPEHRIYAVSYKKKGAFHFPMVWDSANTNYHAENVTEKYIQLYRTQQAEQAQKQGKVALSVIMLTRKNAPLNESRSRVKHPVSLYLKNRRIAIENTSGRIDDLNNYLILYVNKNSKYELRYDNAQGKTIRVPVTTTRKDKQVVLSLK